MGVLEDLADALARDALAAAEELGDETLVTEIANQLGNSSPTMEEAYLTSIRFRSSELRARTFMNQRLAAAKTEKP